MALSSILDDHPKCHALDDFFLMKVNIFSSYIAETYSANFCDSAIAARVDVGLTMEGACLPGRGRYLVFAIKSGITDRYQSRQSQEIDFLYRLDFPVVFQDLFLEAEVGAKPDSVR